MGKIIACPRCEAKVDSGGFAPGSSFRCTDCGGLMRVPSGRTGVHVPVEAETAPPAQAPPRGQTKLRLKPVGNASDARLRAAQARPPKSNAALIVILLLVAVGGGVAFLVMGNSSPQEEVPYIPAPRAVAPKPPPPPVAPAPAPAPVAPAVPPPPAVSKDDPSKANWEQLMSMLRPGGGFDDPTRPEAAAFEKVKKMGKPAWPYLVRYIDNEDVSLGRAAVVVLGELTGNKTPLPNEGTKAKIKSDWEAWLKANP